MADHELTIAVPRRFRRKFNSAVDPLDGFSLWLDEPFNYVDGELEAVATGGLWDRHGALTQVISNRLDNSNGAAINYSVNSVNFPALAFQRNISHAAKITMPLTGGILQSNAIDVGFSVGSSSITALRLSRESAGSYGLRSIILGLNTLQALIPVTDASTEVVIRFIVNGGVFDVDIWHEGAQVVLIPSAFSTSASFIVPHIGGAVAATAQAPRGCDRVEYYTV